MSDAHVHAHVHAAGAGRTRTAPARAPDGFPFGFRRYRSYTLFAATAFPMALAALMMIFALAALSRGPEAWQGFLAGLSSAPAIVLSLLILVAAIYFAVRFGWVGRKIGAGRIGPIPGPPLPLPLLGILPVGGFVTVWIVILAVLGGVFPMIHKLEPLWWFLFGAGGFLAAFTLPGIIIGLFLLGPLGLFESGLAYDRMVGLVRSPIGALLIIAIVSLTLWHCAHHARHFALDLGVTSQGPAYLAYGLALVGTLATVGLTLGI